jgi:hypothetical protein
MERADHRVAVVVDPTYGERVVGLAQECHVWLVRSGLNDEVAATLRKDADGYTLEDGLSTFNGAESPEASFLAILGTVELHHGEYSHDPALSVIQVIGLNVSEVVKDALADCGFRVVEPAPDGFVARREPA